MLQEKIDLILHLVRGISNNSPDIIPIDGVIAKQYGFNSLGTFRKYCMNNFSPTEFYKIGKKWYINFPALLSHFNKDNDWQQ